MDAASNHLPYRYAARSGRPSPRLSRLDNESPSIGTPSPADSSEEDSSRPYGDDGSVGFGVGFRPF
jgi:hypothetical protein